MLIGAVIGLLIISFFVFSVSEPDPEWGSNWRIRPLLVTPVASAIGILSFYLKDLIKPRGTIAAFLNTLLSFIMFAITLWLGTVLRLDRTLWD